MIPESNQKTTDFAGTGYEVNCPFDAPGLETYGGGETTTCTWAGPDRGEPTGTVVLS